MRTCPLCEKGGIKYIGAHLKTKHNLVNAKERAPYLKQSLRDSRDSSAKCKETVPEMREKETMFQKQECQLRDDFLYLEDNIVGLQLRAINTMQSSTTNVQTVREEVREMLIPLYTMVRTSLETIMYEPSMQVKQCDSEVPEPKRKRKKTTDVRFSGCGMDFLKNGLVQCQKCLFTWDGNAQHDCPYEEEVKEE